MREAKFFAFVWLGEEPNYRDNEQAFLEVVIFCPVTQKEYHKQSWLLFIPSAYSIVYTQT